MNLWKFKTKCTLECLKKNIHLRTFQEKACPTYGEIVERMESAARGLTVLGVSGENRRILGLRLGEGCLCVLEAGTHAREWAGPIAAMYVIDKLLMGRPLGVTWLVIPLLNPDGYEYSRTSQRMWRKNKSETVEPLCLGVDINRNFEVHWGKDDGCSPNPCSETYRGPRAWSEPESRAIRDLLLTEDVRVYLSTHSCLQAIMYPPSYSLAPPRDLQELENIAFTIQKRILRTCGSFYTVGQSSIVDRIASGSSVDWARESANIKYSFNIELRGPQSGFILPENEIEKAGRELYEIVLCLSDLVKNRNLK